MIRKIFIFAQSLIMYMIRLYLGRHINKNGQAILRQIDKLRVPLNENSVRFKF